MLTPECKGNASYKHVSIKHENIDLYYKNKPRIFATVPEHSPYLSNEDKTNIVANLTPKAKAVIRRDFLIENFKNAYGSNAIADMLLEFAGKHMPERLADIENGHNEVYEKRHQRIEEKKAVLLVQEQAKQEAEQTEADADNEKQPQSQEVAA